MLSGLVDLTGWALAADHLMHTVVPIMAIGGWPVFGPRGLSTPRIARATTLFPLAYLIFTIARGTLASDWYPYPFVSVHALGYLHALINGLAIGLFFFALALWGASAAPVAVSYIAGTVACSHSRLVPAASRSC